MGEVVLPKFDPRVFQIAILSGLIAYGLLMLGFESNLILLLVSVLGCLSFQLLFSYYFAVRFDYRSATISSLSLGLLLRSSSMSWVLVAAFFTIGSKFLLRWKGRHIFNPTNFGIITTLIVSDQAVWVSSGQWGSVAFFALLLAGLGMVVARRAKRLDTSLSFMLIYGCLVIGRSLYVGEPLAIPLHRLENGALLIFAFLMISDPKTTPVNPVDRWIFSGLVAVGAWYVQFFLYRTNGLLWSLYFLAPIVPLLNDLRTRRRSKCPDTSFNEGAVLRP